MLKYIAIITGAAGGIGKEFTAEMNKEQIDEIWAIGRNEQRLAKLREQYGEKIIPISIDLTSDSGLQTIKKMLNENISEMYLPHLHSSLFRISIYMRRQKRLNTAIPVP